MENSPLLSSDKKKKKKRISKFKSTSEINYNNIAINKSMIEKLIFALIFIFFISYFNIYINLMTSLGYNKKRNLLYKPFSLFNSNKLTIQLLATHSIWHMNNDKNNNNNKNKDINNINNDYWNDLLNTDELLNTYNNKLNFKGQYYNNMTNIYNIPDNNKIDYSNYLFLGDISWLNRIIIHKKYKYNQIKSCLVLNSLSIGSSLSLSNDTEIHGKIIIFESCGLDFHNVEIDNIYNYYDKLLEIIIKIRELHPNSIVVWSKPIYANDINNNVKIIHEFLIYKYLINDNGVLVMFPDIEIGLRNERISLLDIQIKALIEIQEYNEENTNKKKKVKLSSHNYNHKLSLLAKYLSNELNYEKLKLSKILLHPMCSILVNTRKFNDKCLPMPLKLYPVLITGLGGSGTHQISNSLRKNNIFIKHESIDRDGSVSWFYAVNDIYSNLEYPHHSKLDPLLNSLFSPRFSQVIHVIRCPLDQISSFTSHLPKSYEFVRNQMRISIDKNTFPYLNQRQEIIDNAEINQANCPRGNACNLQFSALSWVYWNNVLDSYSDATFSIERYDDIINYVCNSLSTKEGIKCIPMSYIELIYLYFSNLNKSFRKISVSSIFHKDHLEYKYEDIKDFDKELAIIISKMSIKYNENC